MIPLLRSICPFADRLSREGAFPVVPRSQPLARHHSPKSGNQNHVAADGRTDAALAVGLNTAGALDLSHQFRGFKAISLSLSDRLETTRLSRPALWAGRILSTLAVL